ncbi:MAG: hypothetical protein MJ067_05865 [Oscillospiraceae bacterium]|nr:hypothetical protein [Oscillospiraceae bacterium]
MSRFNDERLKKMNPTGIPWEEMTDEQKNALRDEWDKVAGDPAQLYCTCPRTGCRNNHNCQFCATLHRFYDGFPDCLRPLDEEMQKGVPAEYRYNMHKNIQSDKNDESLIDPHDPEKTRANLVEAIPKENWQGIFDMWGRIVRDPKNRACKCKQGDCRYHGNCVKCIALHRAYGSFPACMNYITDLIEEACDKYWAEHAVGVERID